MPSEVTDIRPREDTHWSGYTPRESQAVSLWKVGKAGIRWHSMTCVCEACLNADALCYLYVNSTWMAYPVPDVSGLLK